MGAAPGRTPLQAAQADLKYWSDRMAALWNEVTISERQLNEARERLERLEEFGSVES